MESKKVEPDYPGPGWKHPYVLYIVWTAVLFIFLLGLGYVAYQNGWIPQRSAP